MPTPSVQLAPAFQQQDSQFRRAFDIVRDAIDTIRQRAHAGDRVLVKGDTSARMERIVAALLAAPADVSQLARQEPGWESVRVAKPARPTWLDVDLDAFARTARREKPGLIAAGAAAFIVMWASDYHHLARFAYPAYAFILLMLLFVLFEGRTSKGAQRWIALGPLSFQPSEFAKLAIVIFLAGSRGMSPVEIAGMP